MAETQVNSGAIARYIASNGTTVRGCVDFIFGERGPLKAMGLDVRRGQWAMAQSIADSIDQGGVNWGAVEAPTGTGKGIGYLIPSCIALLKYRARNPGWQEDPDSPKVVVSTSNISLQQQLVQKDVPAVSRVLGVPLFGAILKGRNNYICPMKVDSGNFGAMFESRGVNRLTGWFKEPGCSGDKEDLPFNPKGDWAKVSVEPGSCMGSFCQFKDECPSTAAVKTANEADVVVMNHHMLAKHPGFAAVCLAIDEAHELEDSVRSATSLNLSSAHLTGLIARARDYISNQESIALIKDPLSMLFADVSSRLDDGETESFHPGWGRVKGEDMHPLFEAVAAVGAAAKQIHDPAEKEVAGRFHKRMTDVAMLAMACASGYHKTLKDYADGDWAVYGSVSGDRVTLEACPAEVSHIVSTLQEKYPVAVLTSATMSQKKTFDYFRSCLGFDKQGEEAPRDLAYTLAVPSPYQLSSMGVTVIPTNAPDPKNDYNVWSDWAVRAVVHTVNLMGGRTLVLSSSMRMAQRYKEAIETETKWPVKVQGDAGRTELKDWFANCTEGVLVASRSFFQGIDVAGESLSCVVIDRIPFAPPSDPVEKVVTKSLVKRSKMSEFEARIIPKACNLLQQAAGRLIRSKRDSGVVVILDRRAALGRMSNRILSVLPPFPVSTSSRDIQNAIDGEPIQFAMRRARSVRGRTI